MNDVFDWREALSNIATDQFDDGDIDGLEAHITHIEAERDEARIARDKYIDLYHNALSEQEGK